jgi:hypothetical protein
MRLHVVAALFLMGFSAALRPSSGDSAEAVPPPELVVVAKLVAIEQPKGCGTFHFGEIAEYSDIKVISGTWTSDHVRVLHGCTEMSRREYSETAGTLDRFTVGDYHRLELTTHNVRKVEVPLEHEGVTFADFYSLRVDLARPDAAEP